MATETAQVEFCRLNPDDINVGSRARKDLGDIDELAASIERLGLLNPITVDSSHGLLCGERRLRAVQKLGHETIAVHVVADLADALKALEAERDENTCRMELKPSEKVAIGLRLEEVEEPAAQARRREGQRRGGRARQVDDKLSSSSDASNMVRERVGRVVGMSGTIYQRAKRVCQSGDQEAIAEMDRTGKVTAAYNKVNGTAKPPTNGKQITPTGRRVPKLLSAKCSAVAKAIDDGCKKQAALAHFGVTKAIYHSGLRVAQSEISEVIAAMDDGSISASTAEGFLSKSDPAAEVVRVRTQKASKERQKFSNKGKSKHEIVREVLSGVFVDVNGIAISQCNDWKSWGWARTLSQKNKEALLHDVRVARDVMQRFADQLERELDV